MPGNLSPRSIQCASQAPPLPDNPSPDTPRKPRQTADPRQATYKRARRAQRFRRRNAPTDSRTPASGQPRQRQHHAQRPAKAPRRRKIRVFRAPSSVMPIPCSRGRNPSPLGRLASLLITLEKPSSTSPEPSATQPVRQPESQSPSAIDPDLNGENRPARSPSRCQPRFTVALATRSSANNSTDSLLFHKPLNYYCHAHPQNCPRTRTYQNEYSTLSQRHGLPDRQ